jgi:hypothetical protein
MVNNIFLLKCNIYCFVKVCKHLTQKTLIAIMKLLLILDNYLICCYIVGHTQIDILLCRKLENGREGPGISTIDAGVLDYALHVTHVTKTI